MRVRCINFRFVRETGPNASAISRHFPRRAWEIQHAKLRLAGCCFFRPVHFREIKVDELDARFKDRRVTRREPFHSRARARKDHRSFHSHVPRACRLSVFHDNEARPSLATITRENSVSIVNTYENGKNGTEGETGCYGTEDSKKITTSTEVGGVRRFPNVSAESTRVLVLSLLSEITARLRLRYREPFVRESSLSWIETRRWRRQVG